MLKQHRYSDSSGSLQSRGSAQLRRTLSQHQSGVGDQGGGVSLPATGVRADRPVHKARDSLLSTSSGYTNYRGLFNLAILLLVVSNFRVALENVIKYGILINPLEWLSVFLLDPTAWPSASLLVLVNVFVLAVFAIELGHARQSIGVRTAVLCYCAILGALLWLPVVVVSKTQPNPWASVPVLMIYVCVLLKLISYGHVNHWCRAAHPLYKDYEHGRRVENSSSTPTKKKKRMRSVSPNGRLFNTNHKGHAVSNMLEYPSNLTLANLYYFMAAPTLSYELNFPRSPSRRKWFVVKRAFESVFILMVVLALCQQWMVPLLRNSMVPFAEMDVTVMVERLLKLAVPNHLIWLLCFYWGFHSIGNLMAELLRFADREFYRDWWNSETITYFWQTWNLPVHRWARRHLYKAMLRNGFSSLQAASAVFLFSAFLHEYICSVALGTLRLYAFSAMALQLPFSFFVDKLLGGGTLGNVLFWTSIILGQPLAMLMYVHDWYVIHVAQLPQGEQL